MTAFNYDQDERGRFSVIIDVGELEHPEPIMFYNFGNDAVFGLSGMGVVNLRLLGDEPVLLWKMLDGTVGQHHREGLEVKAAFELARIGAVGPDDLRAPTREEYEGAKLLLATKYPTTAMQQEQAARTIELFCLVHGINAGSEIQ